MSKIVSLFSEMVENNGFEPLTLCVQGSGAEEAPVRKLAHSGAGRRETSRAHLPHKGGGRILGRWSENKDHGGKQIPMENDRWRRCRPLHRKQILYPVPVHRPGLQAHEKAHGGHHRCPIERSHAGKDSAVGESAGERPHLDLVF